MTIKVTLAAALAGLNTFRSIGSSPMPAKGAYRVARLISKLETEARTWNEIQVKMLKKYGALESGARLHIEPPSEDASQEDKDAFRQKIDAFNAEAKEALEQEVVIDYDAIPVEMLPDVKPNDLAAAFDFIAE